MPLKVDVIRDRAAISREVEGGQIENIYRLQVMNTQERAQWFDVRVEGIPGAAVAGIPGVQLDGASSLMVPLRVRIPGGSASDAANRTAYERLRLRHAIAEEPVEQD